MLCVLCAACHLYTRSTCSLTHTHSHTYFQPVQSATLSHLSIGSLFYSAVFASLRHTALLSLLRPLSPSLLPFLLVAMVLETFIRKMMEKYLSDILDGVDHQAVSLQLLKGEVTLDDVKIKPSFLKSLALPFPFPLAFHRAIVHHLQLAINWKLLTSQPLLVKVEGIHLWAEAKAYDALIGADSAYVQHVLAKALQDKLDKLQRDEEVRLALAEADDVEGFKKPSSILARLIAIVTTSLQLEINDLHVCISVPGVDEHPGLHMGLALEHFKFETADSTSWASVPFKLLTGPTYKSLTIRNLSLYLNPDGRANVIAKEDADADKLQDGTKQQIKNLPSLPTEALPAPQIASAAEVAASIHQRRTTDDGNARYQFILKPTSLGLNLTFNKNIIPTVEVHAILDMPQFQLVLTRPQLLTLLHLNEVVSTRTEQVKKCKPTARSTFHHLHDR